ncbi:hypothetical protein DPM19_23295 [Actinomadura craniellae]|uniref:Uncharacterized protein n=1 Tax=Actinomadura craniellae TaxID=2231787 RepID=A0A365H1M9_9ACTN|nr:hypothetical protein [Actinomadura craniellae]RAY12938.1 hypothetical protein DPM19_23295 [Actinomadura craniellae]
MSGDEPYATHNPVVLLLVIGFGVIATGFLVLYGVLLLIRACRTKGDRPMVKAAASLAWAATVGMYTWGTLHLFLLDDYALAQECRAAVGGRLTGYEPSFIPLHFGCRTSDGRTIEAVIPAYVNPSVLGLGLLAIAFTATLMTLPKEELQ